MEPRAVNSGATRREHVQLRHRLEVLRVQHLGARPALSEALDVRVLIPLAPADVRWHPGR